MSPFKFKGTPSSLFKQYCSAINAPMLCPNYTKTSGQSVVPRIEACHSHPWPASHRHPADDPPVTNVTTITISLSMSVPIHGMNSDAIGIQISDQMCISARVLPQTM